MEAPSKSAGFGKGSLFSRLKELKDERKKALEELREIQKQCSHEDVLWVYSEDRYYNFQIYACPDCFLVEGTANRPLRVFASFKDIEGKPENRISVNSFIAPTRDRLSAMIERCREIEK